MKGRYLELLVIMNRYTLLKILSRITEPSLGVVKIKGRVASLLEVGTGMHPDLTGWDIYLNGSLLGMSKPEIDKRFDEIVSFLELKNSLTLLSRGFPQECL